MRTDKELERAEEELRAVRVRRVKLLDTLAVLENEQARLAARCYMLRTQLRRQRAEPVYDERIVRTYSSHGD